MCPKFFNSIYVPPSCFIHYTHCLTDISSKFSCSSSSAIFIFSFICLWSASATSKLFFGSRSCYSSYSCQVWSSWSIVYRLAKFTDNSKKCWKSRASEGDLGAWRPTLSTIKRVDCANEELQIIQRTKYVHLQSTKIYLFIISTSRVWC